MNIDNIMIFAPTLSIGRYYADLFGVNRNKVYSTRDSIMGIDGHLSTFLVCEPTRIKKWHEVLAALVPTGAEILTIERVGAGE